MSAIDLNEQWRELQENYAAMSDEELEAVAQDGYDLTDIAKQALRAEISRRSLKIELRHALVPEEPIAPETESEADPEPEADELTDIGRVWSLYEASQMKQALDSYGVSAFFGPECLSDPRMLRRGFDAGVDVRVNAIDQQRAMVALRNAPVPAEEQPPANEEETPYTPHCPRCHSTEIVFQSLDSDPASKSAFDSKYNWSCDACGYRWKDDGIEAET